MELDTSVEFEEGKSRSGGSSNRVISPSGRCERLSRFLNVNAEKTTAMIRNIPCRCTQAELLKEIESVIPGVNFLYLPASRKREGNLGYAFVNFSEPELAVRFINEFQDRAFTNHPKSAKRASVGYAMLQGYKENVKFYRRSKVSKSENRPYIKRV
jgi:RNA recognition motif-containing protein